MSLLKLKLARDFLAVRWRIVALVLIIASGVGILFGIETALSNLVSTQETTLQALHAADLEIQLLPEDVQNLPRIDRIAGVEEVEMRLAMPSTITLRDGRPLAALVLFQKGGTPAINRLSMLQGRPSRRGTSEVTIDRALADYHGYRIGDPLSIGVGRQSYKFTIVGIAMSPEFLITSSNPEYVVADPGSLGVLWADIGQVSDALGFEMVNSLLLRFAPGRDGSVVTDAVLHALRHSNLERVTPLAESYSYKHVRMEVIAFGVYSPAIVVTLCLLSLAMGMITFRRFIVEKEKEFGVLFALGVRRSRVAVALLQFGLAIGAAGGVAGLVIGWGLGWAFSEVYAKAMHLPLVVHSFDPGLALFALSLGTATGVASLLIAGLPVLRAAPQQLIRAAPVDGYGGKSRHFQRLPVTLRYGLRSLARDRALTLGSVLAMGGSVAVAISYGLAMTSTFGTVEDSFNEERWRYAVDFQYPLYVDEARELADRSKVERLEPYFRTAGELRHGQRREVAVLVGLSTPGALRSVRPVEGRMVAGDDEAVVSTDLARALGVGLGARVEIGKGAVTGSLRIVGLTNDIFLRTVTVTLAAAQRLAQAEAKVTGIYVIGDAVVGAALASDVEHVARVTDKNGLVEHFRQQMHDKMGIVYITILFSVGVSILFVTTLVYLGIAEKRSEFAVLRSLGFAAGRLRTVILAGVGAQVALALALAVPLSLGLVYLLNQRMGRAWFAVQIHAGPFDFAWPMAAALLIAPIVGLLGAREVLGLNIPQYLRGRSI